MDSDSPLGPTTTSTKSLAGFETPSRLGLGTRNLRVWHLATLCPLGLDHYYFSLSSAPVGQDGPIALFITSFVL